MVKSVDLLGEAVASATMIAHMCEGESHGCGQRVGSEVLQTEGWWEMHLGLRSVVLRYTVDCTLAEGDNGTVLEHRRIARAIELLVKA